MVGPCAALISVCLPACLTHPTCPTPLTVLSDALMIAILPLAGLETTMEVPVV